jgi:hypothetical protein
MLSFSLVFVSLSFISLLISILCLSLILYLCIYKVFHSCFSYISCYCSYCISCVNSCSMHEQQNTETEDKDAYCKIPGWSVKDLWCYGIKRPHLYVIRYADSRVLLYCKLGGGVKQAARNYVIKETISQVFLQAVLIYCAIIFPQERAMKTLENTFCEMYEYWSRNVLYSALCYGNCTTQNTTDKCAERWRELDPRSPYCSHQRGVNPRSSYFFNKGTSPA